jgi:hypothetical protein
MGSLLLFGIVSLWFALREIAALVFSGRFT